jgi:hypothetical protein
MARCLDPGKILVGQINVGGISLHVIGNSHVEEDTPRGEVETQALPIDERGFLSREDVGSDGKRRSSIQGRLCRGSFD